MGFKSFFKKAGKIAAAPVVLPAKAVNKGVKKVMRASIESLVRHGLTAVGGGMVATGNLTEGDLQAAVGAILTLGGIVWSVVKNRKQAVEPKIVR